MFDGLRTTTTVVMMHSMKTKNPRLTMTLSPSLAAQLRRMSQLTGNSQAALISELLEGQQKVFHKVIRLLEAAQTARDRLVPGLVEDMEAAQAKIEASIGLAHDLFDDGAAPLLAEAEKITRRSGRVVHARAGTAGSGSRGRPDPRLLTGGSK